MIIVHTESNAFTAINWEEIAAIETIENKIDESLEIFATRIYTYENIYYSPLSVERFLNAICQLGGATYRGRVSAARRILRLKRRAPLLIGYAPTSIIALPLPKITKKGVIYLFIPHRFPYKITLVDSTTVKILVNHSVSLSISLSERTFKKRLTQVKVLEQFVKLIEEDI